MTETVVENKSCKYCGNTFPITDKDLEFYDKISPSYNGVKCQIPSPTLCPDCRQQRRLAFRNERKLYKRTCDATGKQIVSTYSSDKPYKIYDQKIWRSDTWNPMNYGKDFDFSKSFFEQYAELFNNVPKMSIINDNGINSENSEYCYNFSYGKNAYLITTAWHAEDSMYCQYGAYFKNTIDCNLVRNSEVLYECMGTGNCFNSFFLQDCIDCSNCYFGIDLKGCSDCYACVGLRNKKYHIYNKPYTKEEYQTIVNGFDMGSYNGLLSMKEKFVKHFLHHPRLETYKTNCVDCIGDRLTNCKNMVYAFDVFNGENCKFYRGGSDSPKNSYDILVGGEHELGYESMVPDMTTKACFTIYCRKSNDIFYSEDCHASSYMFGCIGLKNKSYCIFNKQYTQSEYEQLVPKIIEQMQRDGEWGEFFPASISPFGYNETVAMEYFPLARDEAISKGYKRMDNEYPMNIPENAQTIKAQDLPENIKDIDDDILNKVIICEVSGTPFRIIKSELEFYRKHNLPLPRKHPDQRHLERMQLRNPRKLRDRTCAKCGKDIQTSYAPERPEIVYCETCYSHEIYG